MNGNRYALVKLRDTAYSISLAPKSLAEEFGTDSSDDDEISSDSASDSEIISGKGLGGDIGGKAVLSNSVSGGMSSSGWIDAESGQSRRSAELINVKPSEQSGPFTPAFSFLPSSLDLILLTLKCPLPLESGSNSPLQIETEIC